MYGQRSTHTYLGASRGFYSLFALGPRGVNGAALAAWEEKVDFLAACWRVIGVKEGDSTFKAFLPDLDIISLESVADFSG